MKKSFLFFAISTTLLASNYRLVPLSSHGIALSSSNVAKSYNADAVFINPANMAFLDGVQGYFGLNLYNIVGSKFKNNLKNGEHGFYGAKDSDGKNFTLLLPTFAFSMPFGENSYIGIAGYTDFDAVYGWNGDFAKSLAEEMSLRSGTLTLSYAYKFSPEFSVGASVSANYAKLKFKFIKDNAQSINYVKAPGQVSTKPTWKDENGVKRDSFFSYSGQFKGESDLSYAYKVGLNYVPSYFDEKLRFALVYNSKYKSDFLGNIDFKISKFALNDFFQRHSSGLPDKAAELVNTLRQTKGEALRNPNVSGYLAKIIFGAVLASEIKDLNGQPLPSQDDVLKYQTKAETSFLYPESINFAVAYEYDRHEFLVNIGRTFWSKFKSLKIEAPQLKIPQQLSNYTQQLAASCMQTNNCQSLETMMQVARQILATADKKDKEEIEKYLFANILNISLPQNWQDTTLFSFGYRFNYNDKWSFMAGFSTEDSPVRRDEISFLAKDSRIYTYSLGAEYRYSKNLIIYLSAMHQHYADVSVKDVDNDLLLISGDFKKQSNQIINLGFSYIF